MAPPPDDEVSPVPGVDGPPPGAPGTAPHPHNPNAVLAVVCLAQFMVVLDISIVNVALPAMQRDLHFTVTNLQWVVTAYALTFGGLLLLGGRLADLFGRRRIFLTGLVLFTGASLLGGLANSQGLLIGARALQGVGAAVLSPATLTIITVTFTGHQERARALGVWSAVAAGGGAAGALFGGILVQYLSWRWILFVNVPIGIVVFILARLLLVESRAEGERQRLDVAGSVTVTAGLLALVYTIVHTDEVSWTSTSTLATGGLAVVLLALFVLVEARVATHPLVPLRLFRNRAITGANLVMFTFGAAMFAMWFFLSLYLQQVVGYDPLLTGLTFLPQTAAIAVGATVAARLAPRFGPRPVIRVAAVVTAVGLFWLSRITPDGTYWGAAAGGGILATLGMGLAFTPIALSATGGVAPQEAGLASGLVNSSRQIGASVGLAALSTVAATTAAHHLGSAVVVTREAVKAAATAGYSRGFLIAAVIAAVGGLLTVVIPGTAPTAETRAVGSPGTEEGPALALEA